MPEALFRTAPISARKPEAAATRVLLTFAAAPPHPAPAAFPAHIFRPLRGLCIDIVSSGTSSQNVRLAAYQSNNVVPTISAAVIPTHKNGPNAN